MRPFSPFFFVALFCVALGFGIGQAHADCTSPAGVGGIVHFNAENTSISFCTGTDWKQILLDCPSGQTCMAGSGQQGICEADNITCTPVVAGPVQCWGGASYGGTTPSPIITAKYIASGLSAKCAIKLDDTVQCWGDAAYGGTAPNPVIKAKSISPLRQAMCAIKTDDTVQCWGDNAQGGATPNPVISAKALYGGSYNTCAIKMDDTVQCWGNSTSFFTAPSGMKAKNIVFNHDMAVCAIKLDDIVQCWGSGSQGATMPSSTIAAKKIIPAMQTFCAIKTDDTAICWGGGGTYTYNYAVKDIVGNIYGAMCAIKSSDNTVVCRDTYYPQGSTTGGTAPSPTIQAKSLYANTASICAIKMDDTVQCWGNVPSAPSMQAKTIASHWNWGTAACAIKLDDTVQCWGGSEAGGTTPSPIISAYSLTEASLSICAIKKQ